MDVTERVVAKRGSALYVVLLKRFREAGGWRCSGGWGDSPSHAAMID
jgi:hypothetical protein